VTIYILCVEAKKSLKIRKRQSESVNRRWTENTMAKWKMKKRTNNDQQATTQKTKDQVTRTLNLKRSRTVIQINHPQQYKPLLVNLSNCPCLGKPHIW